jgi:hypothetical protein
MRRNRNRYKHYRLYVFEAGSHEPLKYEALEDTYPILYEFLTDHGVETYNLRTKKFTVQRTFNSAYLMKLLSILDNMSVEERAFWIEVRNPTGKREKRWSRVTNWNNDLVAAIRLIEHSVERLEGSEDTEPEERLENEMRRKVGRPSKLRRSNVEGN